MEEGADKRTANDEYNAFTVMLYKEVTIDERKKILMTCEVERKFIESNDIADDTKFILKLEEKNIISESNVGPLLKCVEALDLNRLAGIVRSYQSKITTESTNEVAEEKERQSCGHLDEESQLLCVTCCTYVCYECAFVNHKDHEVFSEEEFGNEIEIYQRLVEDELQEVNRMIDSLEQDLNTGEATVSDKEIQREVATIVQTFNTGMERQLELSEMKLSKMKNNRKRTEEKTERELSQLRLLSDSILKHTESKSDSPDLVFLQKINGFKHDVSEGIKKAERISENLKDIEICVRFCPYSLSARFVSITVGPVVGSVRINKDQVVIVTDQRHFDQPAIRLSCVSCDNTSHVYWSHVIESEYFLGYGKKLPRVALCNTLFISSSQISILIGCGNKIFQVNILEPKDTCYFQSFTVKDFCVPEDSIISCISIIRSQSPGNVGLIVIDSVSHSIYKLDKDMKLLETMELNEKPHFATGYFDKKFVYAYSDGKSVKLVNGNSPKYVIRTLENPTKGDKLFYPADMLHDAAAFSILWKSKGIEGQNEKSCKVMVYRSNGDLVRISHENTYCTSNEAIGIGFVKNHGLLCLANGKVKLYDTL
ncbi:uncharacterized protein [Apostichopus japonicus]|uniref:uncharacterized protein isoform X4 n=1 Tax=Stichopus japonicus TaxID=307972 RepID=UPI003AB5D2A8